MSRSYDVVVTDFDGTVCNSDIPLKVLQRFGSSGWMDYDSLVRRGKISFERLLGAQYRMIRAKSEAQVLAFAREHFELRDGFVRLSDLCSSKGIRIIIVSAGLDFCIRDFLKYFDLQVDSLICPRSVFTKEGILSRFPPYRSPARNFKEQVVLRNRRRGLRSVYVGDGYSDFFPATQADSVFAIGGSVLGEECSRNGVAFTSMTDFSAISKILE